MSPWVFDVYVDAVMKGVKMGMERMGMRFMEKRREWRLPSFLYADVLVLCGESAEDLKAMVGRFLELCRRRGLKVSAGEAR